MSLTSSPPPPLSSLVLLQTLTTFTPVLAIFAARESTAILLGAVTSICLFLLNFASQKINVAEVTVLPVPGGPWMREKGVVRAFRMISSCLTLRPTRPGAFRLDGSSRSITAESFGLGLFADK